MKPLTIFPLLAFLASAAAASEAGWELIKDDGTVRIYTRDVPGEAIKELKAVTTMETTVEKLVAAYMDGDNHSQWFPHCLSSKVVKRNGESGFQVYRLIDNPWPVQDRDYVLAAELTRDPATGLLEYVLHFDPGGNTPAGFINMALAKIGTDLFEGLHRHAERSPR